MKKLLMFAMTAICALFIGCDKDLPSVEKMTTLSKTAGVTAGYVANMTKISDKDRTIVIEIMNKVAECVPAKDQKFSDVWTPVAKKYIQELIDAGKIDVGSGTLIEGAISVAIKGIDYAVYTRYPKIGSNVELVNAASKGFLEGFLSVFTPPNCTNCTDITGASNIDRDLYNYLTK